MKLTPDGRVDRSASLVRLARLPYQAGLASEHIAVILAERDTSLGWHKFSEREHPAVYYESIVQVVVQGLHR